MLQNERGNIIESSAGNTIVSNGVLYTIMTDGCGGVMRAQVIDLAIANGIKVRVLAEPAEPAGGG